MKYNISIQTIFSENQINVIANEISNQKIFDSDTKSSIEFIIKLDTSIAKEQDKYLDLIISYLYNSILVKNTLNFESTLEYDSDSKKFTKPVITEVLKNTTEFRFNPITDKPRFIKKVKKANEN